MESVYTVRVPGDLWPSRGDWEGVVVEVHVSPGDRVVEGQVLVEVEIEKAVLEIESPVAGRVVGVHVSRGDRVAPGDPLVDLVVEA